MEKVRVYQEGIVRIAGSGDQPCSYRKRTNGYLEKGSPGKLKLYCGDELLMLEIREFCARQPETYTDRLSRVQHVLRYGWAWLLGQCRTEGLSGGCCDLR